MLQVLGLDVAGTRAVFAGTLILVPHPRLQTLADQPQAATEKFLLPMPKWPERESTLLRQLQKREGVDEDAAAGAAATAAAAAAATAEPTKLQIGVATASSDPPPPPIKSAPSFDLLGGSSECQCLWRVDLT